MKHLSQVVQAIKNLTNEVKDFVVKNGGFINTSNTDGKCDQIYAYIIDWENDSVEEQKVVSVMVEDGILNVAVCPKSINLVVNGKEDFSDEDWYAVCDFTLQEQTIISIAESIEQY